MAVLGGLDYPKTAGIKLPLGSNAKIQYQFVRAKLKNFQANNHKSAVKTLMYYRTNCRVFIITVFIITVFSTDP